MNEWATSIASTCLSAAFVALRVGAEVSALPRWSQDGTTSTGNAAVLALPQDQQNKAAVCGMQ